MMIVKFIQLINIFYFINCKNIILPFNKITIEHFSQSKTINDLINYNIYANISMGSPPQIVAHFIDQDEYWYYFQKRLLSHKAVKSNEIIKEFENLTNFWFSENISSTYVLNKRELYFSDIYYFQTLNKTQLKVENFRANIFVWSLFDKHKCGTIGLKYSSTSSIESTVYIDFFNELKINELIKEYYFTILYEEKNNILTETNSEYLGIIIIGESPDMFNKDKYKEEDKIITNGKGFSLYVNQIKYNSSNNYVYSEENIEIKIKFNTVFISSSYIYQKEINNTFFKELFNNQLCTFELVDENIFTNKYIIYSCKNNEQFKESMKTFPSLIFEIKTKNLTFIFTYKDLFQLYNNRFYFMIIFREEKYSRYQTSWIMGEIFLRKYLTVFNFDAQTISFYKNQVDDINTKSKVIFENEKNYSNNSENENKNKNYIRTFIEIIMGLFIIVILFLLYRKYRNSRKLHENEFEDSNYVYNTKKDINIDSYLLSKEKELN